MADVNVTIPPETLTPIIQRLIREQFPDALAGSLWLRELVAEELNTVAVSSDLTIPWGTLREMARVSLDTIASVLKTNLEAAKES